MKTTTTVIFWHWVLQGFKVCMEALNVYQDSAAPLAVIHSQRHTGTLLLQPIDLLSTATHAWTLYIHVSMTLFVFLWKLVCEVKWLLLLFVGFKNFLLFSTENEFPRLAYHHQAFPSCSPTAEICQLSTSKRVSPWFVLSGVTQAVSKFMKLATTATATTVAKGVTIFQRMMTRWAIAVAANLDTT